MNQFLVYKKNFFRKCVAELYPPSGNLMEVKKLISYIYIFFLFAAEQRFDSRTRFERQKFEIQIQWTQKKLDLDSLNEIHKVLNENKPAWNV